ncbi:MAG TPA: helix-hairpin-helix domain-containing protein [Candidatus Oscillibacter pullicola]|nr:helix-hairpin-helix domain-containing protein [Candidatus Oscillibacter pullicola]
MAGSGTSAAEAGPASRQAARISSKKTEKKRRVFISNSYHLWYNQLASRGSGGEKRRDSTFQLIVYQKTGGSSTVSGRGRPTKSEIILLGLTAVFLCALAGLSLRDRQDRVPGAVIETEVEVPREDIAPEFPPVDLNTATAEELDTLPGIGESLARRIIAYREANGPFGSIEEIMEVSGIGEAKFAELKDRVTVDNGKGEVTNEDSGG